MADAPRPVKRTSKVVVLTGVSRGLGLAMTEEFICRGHIVIGCARSSDALNKLQQRHPKPNSFQRVNVAVETEVRQWAEAVIKRHGPPDLLINNAPVINRNAPLWQIGGPDFSRVIDVNIKGVANVIRHFLPGMIKRGCGVIINFSSGWPPRRKALGHPIIFHNPLETPEAVAKQTSKAYNGELAARRLEGPWRGHLPANRSGST